MARASTYTLIPLDRMAEHLGINPWHFNGITSTLFPFSPNCSDDWYQYSWQTAGKLSRESLAQALHQAEQAAEKYLGYAPAPRWYEETLQIPAYYKVEERSWANSRGMSKSVYTSHGYVFEVGQQTRSLIDTPAVIYTDEDGDGINDLATIIFATTVTDPEELRVYFPCESGADTWEIRPLSSVSISGGLATITFPKWLCVLPELQNKMPSPDAPYMGVDAALDTNFLIEVDVYRVYSDPSTQALMLFEPDLSCSTSYEYTSAAAALLVRDSRLGVVAFHPATWDVATQKHLATHFTNFPDKLTLYYRAGKKDTTLSMPTREMDRQYERMITYYALSLLDTELCGCDNTRNIWQYMTRDLAKSGAYNMPWNKLGNPLGTSYAALSLWEAIQPDKINRPQRRW